MARYTGPRAKICRRLEMAVFESPKFIAPRKNYAPGQHGQRRKKPTDFGVQLMAKQKLKGYYGNIGEKKFRKYCLGKSNIRP